MTHACTIESAKRPNEEQTIRGDGRKQAAGCKGESESSNETKTNGRQERDLDSGYAWLILAVMFLLASSTGGTNRVYGLIYAKQVAIGYYDHEQASWPIATASTVENLAGLMTPALAQFLSWRQIELLATLLFVVANVGAYFSDSLALDILCLGIIQGLALSINTVLSLVINNDYFRRYRTTAYGISLSGSTFGIVYLGPIVSWCLEREELGFRSSYLAIGGVLALNAVLVIFIKPRVKSVAAASDAKADPSADHDASRNPNGMQRKRSLLERHLERKNSVASIALMCKQKRQSQLQRQSTCTGRPSHLAEPQVMSGRPNRLSAVDQLQLATARLKKSLSGSTGLDGLAGETYCEAKSRLSIFSGPPMQPKDGEAGHYQVNILAGGHRDDDNHPDQGKRVSLFRANLGRASLAASSNRSSLSQDSQGPDTGRDHFNQLEQELAARQTRTLEQKRQISKGQSGTGTEEEEESGPADEDEGLSARLVGALLRSPYLHCVWIMLSLYYLIARIFIIILVDLAKDNGLSSGESRALLNYWSLGEIVGRILLCSFVDLQWLSVRLCILFTCAGMSVCIGLMAVLGGSFYLYAICSALVAALISLEYVLINVLMIEYLGQSRVTSCYSLGSLISSLALLGRPALIGLFRDQLGSYNGLLLLLAGLSLAYGLLFGLLEPLLVRYWPKGGLLHRSQLAR